jgi:poly-gamma-glutamate synthesis protein (capsule biosynthesis protein)
MPGYEATTHQAGVAQIRAWTIYEQAHYQPGTAPRVVTMARKEDLENMVEDVKKLKEKVDVAVLCMHWGLPVAAKATPMYCYEIGHAAIDNGVDLIIGTHPHMLQGIEMYKGKAIFYSTGDFALELGPHMRDHEHVKDMDAIYGTDHNRRKHSMIVKAIVEDGQIKQVSYLPCHINRNSEPEFVGRTDDMGQDLFDFVEDSSRVGKMPVHFEWLGNGEVLVLP